MEDVAVIVFNSQQCPVKKDSCQALKIPGKLIARKEWYNPSIACTIKAACRICPLCILFLTGIDLNSGQKLWDIQAIVPSGATTAARTFSTILLEFPSSDSVLPQVWEVQHKCLSSMLSIRNTGCSSVSFCPWGRWAGPRILCGGCIWIVRMRS